VDIKMILIIIFPHTQDDLYQQSVWLGSNATIFLASLTSVFIHLPFFLAMTWSIMVIPTNFDKPRLWGTTSLLECTLTVRTHTHT